MIPDQRTFTIPEREPLDRVAGALDDAFKDGWRIAAMLSLDGGHIVILDRRSVPFTNLNQLQEQTA